MRFRESNSDSSTGSIDQSITFNLSKKSSSALKNLFAFGTSYKTNLSPTFPSISIRLDGGIISKFSYINSKLFSDRFSHNGINQTSELPFVFNEKHSEFVNSKRVIFIRLSPVRCSSINNWLTTPGASLHLVTELFLTNIGILPPVILRTVKPAFIILIYFNSLS